jgi:multidrug efflux pump subunit AcrA (membrane-fusion protein)
MLAIGFVVSPALAQHEGHQPSAATQTQSGHTGHGGMEMSGGGSSYLPMTIGIAAVAFVLYLVVQTARGRRPKWLNRQVIGGTLLLVVFYAATAYVVKKYKKPGQMTVLEANAMDMSAMKPPTGAAPVLTEKARRSAFDAKVTYTGTVVAFTDEDVYPRVTGWIRAMPIYAGDHVQPGQLVARLDATELGSKVNEAAFARLAAEQMRSQMTAEEAQMRAMQAETQAERTFARGGVDEAEKELAASRSMTTEAQRSLKAAQAMVDEATSEVEAAQHGVSVVKSELLAKDHERESFEAEKSEAEAMRADAQSEVTSTQAAADYWRSALKRSEALAKTGAISQQELDRDRADARTAEAKLQQAQAKVREKQAAVRKAEAHLKHLHAEVDAKQNERAKMEADVRRAQARLTQATANAEAMEAKVEQTKSSADAAAARVTQMKAMLKKSESSVAAASAAADAASRKKMSAAAAALQMQAALTTASVVKGYTEIRTNVGGVVTQRLVSPGVLVSPGTPILKIAQIDRVRLQANVAESDVAGIRVGSAVRVKTMVDGQWSMVNEKSINHQPSTIDHLTVTSIFPAADPTARTVIVEAIAPNPERRFVPGQYIVMEISTQRMDNVVTVPNSAIVEVAPDETKVFHTEKQPAVWVVRTRKTTGKTEYYCTMHPEIVQDKPGTCPKCLMKLEPRTKGGNKYAHLVRVTTGATDGKRTVILFGLNGGEEVIVSGHQNLREGDSVSLQNKIYEGHEGHEGHKDKTVYTCPMHPEVTADKPGKCPKCGMDLVKK